MTETVADDSSIVIKIFIHNFSLKFHLKYTAKENLIVNTLVSVFDRGKLSFFMMSR